MLNGCVVVELNELYKLCGDCLGFVIKMENRQEKLSELEKYTERVDKEITMILQSLQWDRKHLLESNSLVPCRYDANHRVPLDRKVGHEELCYLRSEGYATDDRMLPEPLDESAPTIVRFSKQDITHIISRAAQNDPSFKRGSTERAPLTAERLQATFTADERRAIHDAVVSAAPDDNYAEDPALLGAGAGAGGEVRQRPKSKLEVLAELRDMRRRRTKYRGANVASNNFSNVLRDVIKTQMELFTGVKDEPDPEPRPVDDASEQFNYKHNYHTADDSRDDRHGKHTDEYNTERYEESSRSRGKRSYDSHKEKYHREDNGKHRHHERYADRSSKNYRNTEKYYNYKRETSSKDYYEEENGHSSSKYKDKGRNMDDRRYSDKYLSKSGSCREASESRSERSYKSEKHSEAGSRSSKRRREAYEYEDSKSINKHGDHDDCNRRHDTKREDEHSQSTKRKRHS